MLFLMNETKQLIRTGFKRPVYKFETGVEDIKFLIPQEFNGIDISETICIVQCLLPEAKGLYKVCEYDEELYKDRLTVTVPVTTTITKSVGDNESADVKLFLMFIQAQEEDPSIAKTVLKTSHGRFEILNNGSLDSASESDFDEIWEHSSIDDLKNKVDELDKGKGDNITLSGNVIELKSGDDILSTIELPDDVTWEEWH